MKSSNEVLADLIVQLRPEIINEVSLNRLLSHVASGEGFAFVTAFKKYRGGNKNRELNGKLYRHLEQLGKNTSEVEGGSSEIDAKTGEKRLVINQHSFVVYRISREEAKDLAVFAATEYDQDDILYGVKDVGVWLFDGKTGKEELLGDRVTTDLLQQYWSRTHGKQFSFAATGVPLKDLPQKSVRDRRPGAVESVEYVLWCAGSWISGMGWEAKLKRLIKEQQRTDAAADKLVGDCP